MVGNVDRDQFEHARLSEKLDSIEGFVRLLHRNQNGSLAEVQDVLQRQGEQGRRLKESIALQNRLVNIL